MSIINYQLLSIAIVNQHPFLLPNLIYDETFSSHPVRRLWNYRDVWRLPLNSNFSSLLIDFMHRSRWSEVIFYLFHSNEKKIWQKSKWRTWNKCFFFFIFLLVAKQWIPWSDRNGIPFPYFLGFTNVLATVVNKRTLLPDHTSFQRHPPSLLLGPSHKPRRLFPRFLDDIGTNTRCQIQTYMAGRFQLYLVCVLHNPLVVNPMASCHLMTPTQGSESLPKLINDCPKAPTTSTTCRPGSYVFFW